MFLFERFSRRFARICLGKIRLFDEGLLCQFRQSRVGGRDPLFLVSSLFLEQFLTKSLSLHILQSSSQSESLSTIVSESPKALLITLNHLSNSKAHTL